MSVFVYINVHILKRPTERRPTDKKITVTNIFSNEKVVTVILKIASFRVLKSPAQTAFWTFIGTYPKVADVATFEWIILNDDLFGDTFRLRHPCNPCNRHSYNLQYTLIYDSINSHKYCSPKQESRPGRSPPLPPNAWLAMQRRISKGGVFDIDNWR